LPQERGEIFSQTLSVRSDLPVIELTGERESRLVGARLGALITTIIIARDKNQTGFTVLVGVRNAA
jgi:hypothetical protein